MTDHEYRKFMSTQSVHPTTRKVLEERIPNPPPVPPESLSAETYAVLQAIAERFVPQTNRAKPVDIAGRLERKHRGKSGNGWRYAQMPSDREALESGLQLLNKDSLTLHKRPFIDLTSDQQCALLRQVQEGLSPWESLDQKRWFEETLADLVQLWISHPDTYAEIGFSGIADDKGWSPDQLLHVAEWEPKAESGK